MFSKTCLRSTTWLFCVMDVIPSMDLRSFYNYYERELRSEAGRRLYAARKHIVEPVFGQFTFARGFRKFLLRGLEKVAAEWQPICSTHTLLENLDGSVAPKWPLTLTVRAEAGNEVN